MSLIELHTSVFKSCWVLLACFIHYYHIVWASWYAAQLSWPLTRATLNFGDEGRGEMLRRTSKGKPGFRERQKWQAETDEQQEVSIVRALLCSLTGYSLAFYVGTSSYLRHLPLKACDHVELVLCVVLLLVWSPGRSPSSSPSLMIVYHLSRTQWWIYSKLCTLKCSAFKPAIPDSQGQVSSNKL